MTDTRTISPHPGEGRLLALLDRDGDAEELDRVELHVQGCRACTVRLARLRRQSAGVSQKIAALRLPPGFAAPPAPPIRQGRTAKGPAISPWMRAAAAILLLAGPIVAFEPVRERVREVWARATEARSGTADGERLDTPNARSTIRFVPAGDRFTVSFETAEPEGVLTLNVESGEDATFEVLAGESTLLVTSGRISVQNESGAAGLYRLTLPASVQTLRVESAGQEPRDFAVPVSGVPSRVLLGTRSPE